tara:strand:- start:56 stop:331 length:276 start_codon:yes stop_codon:yes gene_type:complete
MEDNRSKPTFWMPVILVAGLILYTVGRGTNRVRYSNSRDELYGMAQSTKITSQRRIELNKMARLAEEDMLNNVSIPFSSLFISRPYDSELR